MNRLLNFFLLFLAVLLMPLSSQAQSHEQADQYFQQAKNLSEQEKYLEAARMFEKSSEAELASSKPRLFALAVQYHEAGYNFFQVSQNDKAIECFQKALEIIRKQGNEGEIATFLSNIGSVYDSLGQHDKAIEHYQQALEIDRKLGREAEVAVRLNNIGSVYDSWGQYKKAIEYYQQALEINRKTGREADAASFINNIGGVYKSLGLYDKAIKYYQQALEIDKRQKGDANIAIDLNNIGSVNHAWGRYDKAIEYYQQALKIDMKLGRVPGIIVEFTNLGGAYRDLSQYDKAIKYYQQALDISRKYGRNVEVAVLMNNIGEVYSYWKQYDKAIEYYQQAFKIDRSLGRKAEVALRLNNIGSVYVFKRQYNNAINYFQQALEITQRLGKKADSARNLCNIGVVYTFQGQYNKAIDHYHQSIQLMEEIRQSAKGDIRRDYLASHISTYQDLTSAYLKKGNPVGVLSTIEKSRARLLAERISGIKSKMPPPSLKEVQKGLAADEAVLIFSNINYDNFILMVITNTEVAMKEINKNDFLIKCLKMYQQPILMKLDQQRGIKITKNNKNENLAFEKKKQQADFETAIHYYRTLISKAVYQNEARDLGKLLYNLLIAPAEKQLLGKTKITIMPDGILGFLPFETLIDENNNYLIHEYNLRYIQSLTIDKLLFARDYAAKINRIPLLALGGAIYAKKSNDNIELIKNSTQLDLLKHETERAVDEKRSVRNAYISLNKYSWPDLPGTLEEVKAISNIIKNSDILVGKEVTENQIKKYSNEGKLAYYKVLHFATHGLVVPEIPELSALVLSQFKTEQDGEDGFLRMGEIAQLDINADFVNLSACETGLGRIYGGEGVVGLTQSFLIAGANGLSVSLWQVADDSTALFMSELYKKVELQKISYMQAIAETKRGFINGAYGEKWKAPYYWAPFVYYGKQDNKTENN